MPTSSKAVATLIEDFEACRLAKANWTHHVHLTAGFWYLHKHVPGEALALIRTRIKRHNEAVGTANTDSSGYHETLTRLYLAAIASHMRLHQAQSFESSLSLLLSSPLADSSWPLQFYSRARLFSVTARHQWVEPDLQPLPDTCAGVVFHVPAPAFLLRPLSTADLAAFQSYRHDPELGRYQGWAPQSDTEAQSFLATMSTQPFLVPGAWTQSGIADPVTQTLIGDLGIFLDPTGHYAEIGLTLARPAQGRGVATAALREAIRRIFTSSQVERVLCVSDARNTASVRMLERAGMNRTATRDAVFRGEQCIEHVYTLQRNAG